MMGGAGGIDRAVLGATGRAETKPPTSTVQYPEQ